MSDDRYISNVSPYLPSLSELSKIAPIKYSYSQGSPFGNGPGETEVGFSAQSVKGQIPEAIREITLFKGGSALSVDPTKLIPLLVNAIKALALKVDQLEAKLPKTATSAIAPTPIDPVIAAAKAAKAAKAKAAREEKKRLTLAAAAAAAVKAERESQGAK